MAFNLANLSCIANNAKSGVIPALWEYYNSNSDTITTAGYFPPNCGIKAKDKILVISATASDMPMWYYASVTSGVITVSACSQPSITLSLNDLSDVTITSATDNDILTYDTDKWVNEQPSS